MNKELKGFTPEELKAYNDHIDEHVVMDKPLHFAILQQFLKMYPCDEQPMAPMIAFVEGAVRNILENAPVEHDYRKNLRDRLLKVIEGVE